LQAEEMALLIGSVSLFIVMSAVMIATRRLNWYALTDVNDNP
jgi:inner membrane protein